MDDLQLHVARFWGLFTIAVYAPTLINRKFYETLLRVKEREDFVILSGLLSITVGAAAVAVFNTWEWGLAGVLTFMGWLNLVKGVFRFLMLGVAQKAVKEVKQQDAVVYPFMIATLTFGVYLAYRGFAG
jgi:hypothetical protein